MKAFLLIALATAAFGAPAIAQPMNGSMPGMSMPMPKAKPATKSVHPRSSSRRRSRHRAAALPAQSRITSPGRHDMSGMPGMSGPSSKSTGTMPGMSMPSGERPGAVQSVPPAAQAGMAGMPGMNMPAQAPAAAEEPVGDEPPPPPITDHAADRVFDPAAMAAARAELRREHGGAFQSMVMANLAEYQTAPGGGGYRWDGEARFGGDINRLVVKSEGDGSARSGLGAAEVQALYGRAIDPYVDIQVGVRQDLGPGRRTYATAGVEGLLPYWFDVGAAVFVSTSGEFFARAEGTYDLRLTQRLILQPRVELNFAAQDTPASQTGSGLSNAELGLRLRYEIRRNFAPYVGVSYDRKVGRTADFARLHGDDVGGASFVTGVRAWF